MGCSVTSPEEPVERLISCTVSAGLLMKLPSACVRLARTGSVARAPSRRSRERDGRGRLLVKKKSSLSMHRCVLI